MEPTQIQSFNPVLAVKQISYFDDRFYRLVLYDNSIVFLPSVTTVLHAVPKPFLATWRGNIGNREADRVMYDSSQRGSRVHHACYVYAIGGGVIWDPPSHKGMADLNVAAADLKRQFMAMGKEYVTLTDQDEMMMVLRFKQWIDLVKPTVLGAEMTVYSLELGVAGTLDYVHRIEAGKYAIASKPITIEHTGNYLQDLKSGNEDASYWMQLAAYGKMWELSTGQRIDGGFITYLDTDTKTGIEGSKTVFKNWEELRLELEDFMTTKKLWLKFFGNRGPKVFDFPNLLYKNVGEEIPHDYVVPNVNDRAKDVLPSLRATDAAVVERDASATAVAPAEAAQPAATDPKPAAAQETARTDLDLPRKPRARKAGADLSSLT